jgi:HAE1 family hydrophobic/amphiphilic exporter-1
MISRFFIDRPVFANVIAIVILLLGVVSLYQLPVEQYPPITPPTVVVSTNYPGANAQVVADTVAAPIEQQINGVENMLYMSSTCSADGGYSLTVTFEIGTDLDEAQVLVQNRMAVAEPQLPEEVRRQGVTVKKQSSNIILGVSLTSPAVKDTLRVTFNEEQLRARGLTYAEAVASITGRGMTAIREPGSGSPQYKVTAPEQFGTPEALRAVVLKPPTTVADVARVEPWAPYDGLFLANYATLRLRDELSRVKGVGEVMVRGRGAYAMRIWLDPDRLRARGLTTQEVIDALRRQNVQVAAGQVGQPPVGQGQQFTYTVTTLGRLSDPEQFEGIVLKTGTEGRLTFLRDVGRVELGAQNYDSFSSRSGMEASTVLVYQLPDSNALEVARGVRATMEQVSKDFPPGLTYTIPFDTTKYVDASIKEVYRTLIEAGALVLIVILVFLQSWRALLVPATTVPITIIGAFAFLPLLGFSVNLLTLFGLILAIGIVVDDAIVIVENAAHHVERGMKPREATIQAMSEVTGPVISITLVLLAVFLPTAFLGGVTGEMYRQFALTIAATALISAVNALTLKPAQCASWLRPPPARRNLAVRAFNAVYNRVEAAYAWSVRGLLRVWWLVLLVFVGLAAFTGWWYQKQPTGFLPVEDQGYVLISITLPDAASLERTGEVIERMNKIVSGMDGPENWFAIGGFSMLEGTNTPNSATMFVVWKDWSVREQPHLVQDALVGKLRQEFGGIQEAQILVLIPPSIRGLGMAGGFEMRVEDREGVGLDELQARAQELVAAAQKDGAIGMANATIRAGVPQVYLNIDRVKAEKMGVPSSAIFNTLQANLGSFYVNDFNKFGRTYQVRIQADQTYRDRAEDVRKLEVRNRDGQMVQLGTLLTVEEKLGPSSIGRYNLYPSAQINGAAAPGVSSGDALTAMDRLASDTLPPSMGYDWTGIAYQEKQISGEAIFVFAFAVLMVYLVLAAQYESWILPFAVILVVPLGILGVVTAIWLRGLENSIYTQIGVVLIIALASKNAILIVEFARERRAEGMSIRDAALKAARMRFRPILMTSFAFILGVAPLVWSKGAGAMSRQALGTAVFGGMLTATFLAVFFVPVFFIVMQKLSELRYGPPVPEGGHGTDEAIVPLAPVTDRNGEVITNGHTDHHPIKESQSDVETQVGAPVIVPSIPRPE